MGLRAGCAEAGQRLAPRVAAWLEMDHTSPGVSSLQGHRATRALQSSFARLLFRTESRAEMVPGACASLKRLRHAGVGVPAVSVTLRPTEAGSFFGVHFTQRKPTEVPREGS